MQTTLGLSITSTSVGWILVDGDAADATLDHDAFAIQASTSTSQLVAAARGAQAIAIAAGHDVQSIGVTWTDKHDVDAPLLLHSLTDLGFEKVVTVQPAQAAQTFAQRIGRRMRHEKTAVCIIEPGIVTVVVVNVEDGTARTDTYTGDTGARLIRWLTKLFKRHDWQPEALYLISPHTSRDALKSRLEAALPMRVFASADAQLAPAIGAALASGQKDDPRPRAPWLPTRNETVLTLVTCTIAIIAAVALFPKHDSQPVESQPQADTPALPTTVAPGPPPVSGPPAAQLTPMAEQVSAAELEVTPAQEPEVTPAPEPEVTAVVNHLDPAPQQAVANEQPSTAPAPLVATPESLAPPTVVPAAPQQPALPPDPIHQALSPLFSALP